MKIICENLGNFDFQKLIESDSSVIDEAIEQAEPIEEEDHFQQQMALFDMNRMDQQRQSLRKSIKATNKVSEKMNFLVIEFL